MELSITRIRDAKQVISNQQISLTLRRARAIAHKRLAACSIVFVGDSRMRMLQARYRKVARTTDVLSFALSEGRPVPRAKQSGEIFINVHEVKRKARHFQAPQASISKFLLVHGFLHCCGFDHTTQKEQNRMRTLERRICGPSVYYETTHDHR